MGDGIREFLDSLGKVINLYGVVVVEIKRGGVACIALCDQACKGDKLVFCPRVRCVRWYTSGGSDTCSDLQVFEQGPALEGAKGMVCCGGDGFAQGRFEFKRGLDTVVDDVRDRAGVDFPVVSESMN